MTKAPTSWWVSVPIVLGLLFGGGFAGEQLATVLAPNSAIASFISFLVLPASLVLGFVFWLGTASFIALRHAMKRKKEDMGTAREEHAWGKTTIPPGSKAFVSASIFPSAFAGVLVGLFSSEFGFVWIVGIYIGIGLVYGLICWKLAENGYLPFPNE